MPQFGIVTNSFVSNVINAENIDDANAIASTLNIGAIAIDMGENLISAGIGWKWDGTNFISPDDLDIEL